MRALLDSVSVQFLAEGISVTNVAVKVNLGKQKCQILEVFPLDGRNAFFVYFVSIGAYVSIVFQQLLCRQRWRCYAFGELLAQE